MERFVRISIAIGQQSVARLNYTRHLTYEHTTQRRTTQESEAVIKRKRDNCPLYVTAPRSFMLGARVMKSRCALAGGKGALDSVQFRRLPYTRAARNSSNGEGFSRPARTLRVLLCPAITRTSAPAPRAGVRCSAARLFMVGPTSELYPDGLGDALFLASFRRGAPFHGFSALYYATAVYVFTLKAERERERRRYGAAEIAIAMRREFHHAPSRGTR